MSYIEEVLEKLLRVEKEEFLFFAKKWGLVEKSLEGNIQKLIEVQPLTRNQLYKLDSYKEFLLESKKEITKFNSLVSNTIANKQEEFINESKDFLLKIGLNKVHSKVVNKMIGFSKEGMPLFELLNKSYPETVIKITDILIESTALGRNPLVTARLMKEEMLGNLNRAIRIARTEQLNSFREANRLQLIESKIVDSWIWIAEPDACEYCLERAGKAYPLSESMDTHPNCRCGLAPNI